MQHRRFFRFTICRCIMASALRSFLLMLALLLALGPGAAAQPAAEGSALLMQVREALGGEAFTHIENVQVQTTTVVESLGGEATITNTATLAFPDCFRIERRLPNGLTLTLVSRGDTVTVETPDGIQQAPAPVQKQIEEEQLWHNLIYLMAHAADERLEVSAEPAREVEGTRYDVLRITPPVGRAFTLFIDPATQRPARLRYKGSSPQSGAPITVENMYSDYREVAGILVPFRQVTFQRGEKASTSTMTNLTLNASLREDLFTLE